MFGMTASSNSRDDGPRPKPKPASESERTQATGKPGKALKLHLVRKKAGLY
jgi:hypothetical protein